MLDKIKFADSLYQGYGAGPMSNQNSVLGQKSCHPLNTLRTVVRYIRTLISA